MNATVLLCLTTLFVIPTGQALAQVADTLHPHPNVQPLRKIWVKEGERANALFGDAFGGLGDIYGIGRSAWAISNADPREWRVYTWDTATLTPRLMQTIPGFGAMQSTPVVGDFYGSGTSLIGLPTGYFDTVVLKANTQLYFFRSDSNQLDTVASLILNTLDRTRNTWTEPSLFRAIDLDGDAADELIMYVAGAVRNDTLSRKPEVWIYKGGPDFQVDTPTVILYDTERNNGLSKQAMFVGDVDGDHRPDIVTSSDYAGNLLKLKFYFSTTASPWNWTTPEHEVLLKNLSSSIPIALDCTGDSLLDIAMARTARVDLYRSNSGKDVHVRSFDSTDADNVYLSNGYIAPQRFGYLNDSNRRYEMLGIQRIDGNDCGLSGAPDGPDARYETINSLDILPRVIPVGDVTGDGWDDLMTSYASSFNPPGTVTLFAGGPYIPRDPALGVRTVATPEQPHALHVWPNPMHNDLHIAWRGDLPHMPRRFTVHDIRGEEIDQGRVEPWRGDFLWNARMYPTGTYLITLIAADGSQIATVSVIKD